MPVVSAPPIAPIEPDVFDDDDEGWQDMPVVREDDGLDAGFDEEDQKKYHYMPQPKKGDSSGGAAGNATGNLLDIDYEGNEWRAKADQNESEYTRLRMKEEDESDEVHLRTRYLFDEDKAMTPLSQMQQTKDMLTEAQRIAYVGICALTTKEMIDTLKAVNRKELKKAIQNMELWALKIMGRLYYHMELATEEQKMIASLGQHGIQAKDLVPPLMTTHTVANPEYDPAEARKQADERQTEAMKESADISESTTPPSTPPPAYSASPPLPPPKPQQTTSQVLENTSAPAMPGVSTHLSAADKDVTLDIRWTVLCDLFLVLIADSVYDARSRVLLESVALKLGLGWLDVVKFESRVTEALEIQEGVERLEQQDSIQEAEKNSKKRRYMMLGLATLGGGLVIGLSAGLLAPVIGAGLGAAFTTIGITGTTGFLAGTGGAAVITTGGVLTGSGIAARGMARRTQHVRTFELLPLHNHKRVNCILTVPGFMNGIHDDVRLPFSVLDPVVGDVFSVLWEPEMIRETGSALKILTSEVLSQLAQTALQATVMTALMSALQWPIILTKLGYLIDNPWSNALDRAKGAGSVLAEILLNRHLGVRPITLIGFSLGARVIFYALVELAKKGAFGIVQDVILLGATVTAPLRTWLEVRSVVSGRFVNGYARNDWVLNYLFRATSGGLNTVAGLRPVQNVPGLENVDVTDKIAGHMSYRTFMPLILDQLGFPVSADYFDEPEEPDFEGDRVVIREGEETQKKGWFGRKKKSSTSSQSVSRPPSAATFSHDRKSGSQSSAADEDLPPREGATTPSPSKPSPSAQSPTAPSTPNDDGDVATSEIPAHAGFDFAAIKEVLGKGDTNPDDLRAPTPSKFAPPHAHSHPPTLRTESAPPPVPDSPPPATPKARPSLNLPPVPLDHEDEPVAGPSSSSRADLSASLSRSLSLNNMHDDFEADMTSYSRHAPSSRPPVLSFGGSDGSIWPSHDPDPTPTAYRAFGGGYQAPSNFAALRSADVLSNPFASGTSGLRSDELPAPPDNPFAASAGAPSLSFGGIDGSISFAPSSTSSQQATRAPWDIGGPYGSGKKASSTLDLNPWQS
ncbi:DUF726-domain-containing protein [Trametes versicolor FP-101664 SS1]|uniref:DUF726-domain-containing protein n=1 Tax=Trametes versicolor (strain FP-101664) TaxID=717944 RepID=UPI0004621FFE|nr:DUF726-domain-containing protein [Trametes versicolor FP-101664 SS1]EIW64472.1 DUF726-domain-containing protein [Trametes versicolor FP-101664 SS1]